MTDYVAEFKFFIEYPNLIDYSKFFKNPIVIGIIIFILALIGVGIYFIVRPKKNAPNGGSSGSGPTGPSGPTGSVDPSGSTGDSGPTGATGPTGPSSGNCSNDDCTQCNNNWDPANQCTTCINGWDPTTNCTSCVLNRGPGPSSSYAGDNKCGLYKQITSTDQWFITANKTDSTSGCYVSASDSNCNDYFYKYGARGNMKAVDYCRSDKCCGAFTDRVFCTTSSDWYTNSINGNQVINNPTCPCQDGTCGDYTSPDYDNMTLWIDDR